MSGPASGAEIDRVDPIDAAQSALTDTVVSTRNLFAKLADERLYGPTEVLAREPADRPHDGSADGRHNMGMAVAADPELGRQVAADALAALNASRQSFQTALDELSASLEKVEALAAEPDHATEAELALLRATLEADQERLRDKTARLRALMDQLRVLQMHTIAATPGVSDLTASDPATS